MKQFNRKAMKLCSPVAAAALAMVSAPVAAGEFTLGESGDIKGTYNLTISAGAGWRMAGRDPGLYSGDNLPGSGGTGGNAADDGNLNYKKGKMYSSFTKAVGELDLKKDNYGVFVRGKAWYDDTLSRSSVPHGNGANNYAPNTPLSDAGLETLQKFQGAYLLDAYAYGNWKLDGGNSFNGRVGRQALNWGESLFFQGINVVSPLDVPAFRRPGVEIKEAFLPVGMLYGNWGFANGPSVEAFYQYQWQATAVDGCGTYFSTVDIAVGPGAHKSGCNVALLPGTGLADQTMWNSNLKGLAGVPLVNPKLPKNGGQYGVATRYFVDALNTEFGAYAINIHSRTPVLNGVNAPAGQSNIAANWEYPENVKVYALSASTTLGGWSIGSELSHSPNYPAAINGGDLLYGTLLKQGPMAGRSSAAGDGNEVKGFDRVKKTQFQLNGIQGLPGILGADGLTAVGEIAGSWVSGLTPGLRYGREFVFGFSEPSSKDGYVTNFAWGYRVLGKLDYFNFMNSGVTVSPSLSLSHDVKGVSVDGQINEGRRILGLGVDFNYQKKYNLGVQYVKFNNKAKWDALRDRDYLTVNASMAF